MATFIEIHLIQTVPPSCLNRDENGSPKTAVFGGTTRARVSSQAWKKAARAWFRENLGEDRVGKRTKELPRLIADKVKEADPSIDDAEALRLACDVLSKAGLGKVIVPKAKKGEEAPGDPTMGALVFLAGAQIAKLAQHALAYHADAKYLIRDDGKADPATVKAIKADANADHAVDIALFGRMLAESKDINVDAACQVAHALGVSSNQTEFDFFTAVDDVKADRADADAGGAMLGTIEYNSATLYRYAAVNLDHLAENLGSADEAKEAALLFLKAFTKSLPTGRQNTFAAHTLPAAIHVVVRDNQPLSLVGAFEKPIQGTGVEEKAIKAMLAKQTSIERMYGNPARATFTATEESGSLTDILDGVRQELS